jgi:CBS domain-containing protein
MSPNPVTLDPQTAASDALRLLGEVGFRHLPIVEEGEIRGIISLRDFVGVELRPEGAEADA